MKALIVLTNVEKYETIERPTGLWLSELTHFYDVLVKNNISVDFVSPKGGYVPVEPQSILSMDATDWTYYKNEEFRNRALGNTFSPDQVNPEEYAMIYYAGGHGTMWDFPNSKEIGEIASAIYQRGGIVSAVCHGVVGLLQVTDENNQSILAGRTVTGFSNEEELNGTTNEVPFLAEDALKEKGANYEAETAFSDVVRADGRLITGQNPQSAHSLGEAVVAQLLK
ncbi:MAG: type 1 glutamine amidotransferase domain-containing protein [Enterococcus sp.]